MKLSLKKVFIAVIFLSIIGFVVFYSNNKHVKAPEQASDIKLYWFIPDGMRAEPYVFNIYKWAREGKLPNIKKMMENGSYGYCKPVYPGHTPVNFATLMTGTYPEVHGVSDGPMHTEGNPLTRPSVAGFRSTAKKVEPIWVTLENDDKKVGILSVPGSTPPELKKGYTLLGRWGGWGGSFYPVIFEELGDGAMKKAQGEHARLFFFGPSLMIFEHASRTGALKTMPVSYSEPKEAVLNAWGAKVFAYIYDSTDNGKVDYNRIAFSFDRDNIIADLDQGGWSNWYPISLKWKELNIDTVFKIKVIKLDDDGFFRIRFLYNAMNETLTEPSYLSEEIVENVGPMVDYVDNFPPQLIFYNEDKATFIEEANMSFDWHRKVVPFFLKKYDPDIFIHDIYSPNQMLTSRWWMGYVDPDSPRYNDRSEEEREELWKEVKDMYKKLDDIVGEYLDNADENTIVVLSSDHGVAPLHKWVNLNNYFSDKGWLKFKIDDVTGETSIDWSNSQVVFLKFDNIYINPEGLHSEDGNWHRASGVEYEELRGQVIESLRLLEDDEGIKPVVKIATWEDAEIKFRLPHERVGDIVVANRPGYGFNEKMSEDKVIFKVPLKTGHKQAIISDDYPAVWCTFMIMGPGVKKNNFLGDKPINMVDQYPTIMKLLGVKTPDFVQGKPIDRVFTEEFRER